MYISNTNKTHPPLPIPRPSIRTNNVIGYITINTLPIDFVGTGKWWLLQTKRKTTMRATSTIKTTGLEFNDAATNGNMSVNMTVINGISAIL